MWGKESILETTNTRGVLDAYIVHLQGNYLMKKIRSSFFQCDKKIIRTKLKARHVYKFSNLVAQKSVLKDLDEMMRDFLWFRV